MTSASGFSLTKWYLDCVDAAGRCAIAYWAALGWRGLTLKWHSVQLHQPAGPPFERSRLAAGRAPDRAGDGGAAGTPLIWAAPRLGCRVTAAGHLPPVSARLLDSAEGAVDWHCEMPAAAASIEIADHGAVHGTGYAERLVLSLPPWRLPIAELRWGRWMAADASRSLVWIDWRGPLQRRWIFLDGLAQADGEVDDAVVSTRGASLRLDAPRRLTARPLASIVRSIPALAARTPVALLAIRETKWCSAGTLVEPGVPPLTGWAIHELVAFA